MQSQCMSGKQPEDISTHTCHTSIFTCKLPHVSRWQRSHGTLRIFLLVLWAWARHVSREGLSRKLAGKHTPDEELQREYQAVTRRSHLPVTLRPAVMVWPLSFSSPTPELLRVRPRVGLGDVAAEDILSDIVVLGGARLDGAKRPLL